MGKISNNIAEEALGGFSNALESDFDKNGEKNKAIQVKTKDERMRESILKLVECEVSDRISDIELTDILKNSLKDKAITHDMTINEIISALSMIRNTGTEKTKSILEPFKATGNTPSPMLTPTDPESEETNEVLESMTSNEVRALDKMVKVLENIKPSESEKTEE